jgi:ADP-heptose:LPS heptosyltransferase
MFKVKVKKARIAGALMHAMSMKNFFFKTFLILKHYLTFWHLKRAFIFILVDILFLSFIRKGKSDTILILKFDQLGDYIISRNFLIRIRDYAPYKSKRIVLCGNIALKDFIETYDANAFDEFIWIDRARLLNEIGARFKVLRQVKMMGSQIAIQCTYGLESFSADCVMRASGARERFFGRWISRDLPAGRPNGRKVRLGNKFYTPLVEPERIIFDFYRHQSLFSVVLPGLDLPKNTRLTPIPVPLPHMTEPFAILMPGASDAFREWPPDCFARIARHLFEARGLHILVLGTKADSPKAIAIQQAAPTVVVENLCGQLSLPQVAYLMSRCVVGVTNDSGGIHLLAALNKPGVAVSNCFSFGLFHPYPKEISDSVSFVYPQAFYALPLSMQERKLIYGGGKHFPITEVQSESVIERIEALLQHLPFHDPIRELNG